MADEEPLGLIELDQNLEDVERPPELPNGSYIGEVQEVQIATSAGKGNKYYAIRFRIPPDQIPADLQEHYEDGAVLSWNRQLVPNPSKPDRRVLFSLKQLIKSLGLDANANSFDPNDWMGQSAKLIIKQSKWQGEDRAGITAVEPAEGPQPKATSKAAPAAKGAARGARR